MGRGLHADERGISPVLGTALLLAMAVTALTIFLAVWVPGEVNRREEEHMRGVEESFRELGVTIDDLIVGENGSVNVKMGPDPLPLLPNPRTGGTLSVTSAENVDDRGHLEFSWGSRSLVYESGMVILVQDNMSFMKSPPGTVTVMQVDNDNFEVHFNVIRVQGVEGSVSGTGTLTFTVSVLNEEEYPPEENNNVTISINSSYRDAWWEYLVRENAELKAIGITAELKEEENLLTLTIKGDGKTVHFYQKVTDIKVNLG